MATNNRRRRDVRMLDPLHCWRLTPATSQPYPTGRAARRAAAGRRALAGCRTDRVTGGGRRRRLGRCRRPTPSRTSRLRWSTTTCTPPTRCCRRWSSSSHPGPTTPAWSSTAGSWAPPRSIELGFLANRNPPLLHTHDRYGHRIDEVEFHPAWHRLLDLAVSGGLHSMPWEGRSGPAAHGFVERAALTYVGLADRGRPLVPDLDDHGGGAGAAPPTRARRRVGAAASSPAATTPPRLPAEKKAGLLIGMGMTEKQGGSDVRANTTVAVPVDGGGPGAGYVLTGHKWFTSAPMNDAFLVLAQAPGGLSCFLVPRWTPDGERNTLHIQRLKDKLGNRSNASAEIELDRAWARMVGEEGRGVATILEMVNVTRLDCVTGSAALMRQAVAQAAHHVAHRRAFGSAAHRQAADAQRGRRSRGRGRGRRGADGADGGDVRPSRRRTSTRRRCGGSSPRWPSTG